MIGGFGEAPEAAVTLAPNAAAETSAVASRVNRGRGIVYVLRIESSMSYSRNSSGRGTPAAPLYTPRGSTSARASGDRGGG